MASCEAVTDFVFNVPVLLAVIVAPEFDCDKEISCKLKIYQCNFENIYVTVKLIS